MNKKGLFLKKHVNLFILFLVIMVITIYVTTSVLYQQNIRGLSEDYTDTSSNLSSCELQLQNFRDQLFQTVQILNTSEESVKKYDELYESKESQLEEKESELVDTKDQLEETQTEVDLYEELWETEKDNSARLELEIESLNDELGQYNDTILELEDTIDDRDDEIDDLEDKVECLEATADTNETAC